MKLQDLLRHIADNVENGRDWCDGLVSDKPWSMKEDVMTNYHSFELAPRTHVVNGFTVSAPQVEDPAHGEYYYTSCSEQEDWYNVYTWCNNAFDNRMLNRGCVFLTAEAAIANAKAEKGIDPYSKAK